MRYDTKEVKHTPGVKNTSSCSISAAVFLLLNEETGVFVGSFFQDKAQCVRQWYSCRVRVCSIICRLPAPVCGIDSLASYRYCCKQARLWAPNTAGGWLMASKTGPICFISELDFFSTKRATYQTAVHFSEKLLIMFPLDFSLGHPSWLCATPLGSATLFAVETPGYVAQGISQGGGGGGGVMSRTTYRIQARCINHTAFDASREPHAPF